MNELASPGQLRLSYLRWALVTVPSIVLLGILSGRVSQSGYGNPWFDALVKPAIMPPGWAFGLAWTILYVLMGLAFAMILNARRAKGRGLAITLFLIQLVMNLAWSPLFFAAHQVTAALGLIVALALLNVVVAAVFWRIRPVAGLLFVPYILWLGFATGLNYQIHVLNPDAERLAPGSSDTQISL
ncbi:TspO/MBR family protein [Sphingomonas montanisoli]|uniref:Tryptophan-rich sensory protein n=1 Tax=Sphingomonas montanisoli TaxID=2606412 RepID=A0A5D9C8H4_9SPHN|nr:TspO/MBR family protein [Sphingomonas montanisoli]TZG27577.1 tryptophan-rich sensory protein [Sphingomonas montanisoli]